MPPLPLGTCNTTIIGPVAVPLNVTVPGTVLLPVGAPMVTGPVIAEYALLPAEVVASNLKYTSLPLVRFGTTVTLELVPTALKVLVPPLLAFVSVPQESV